MSTEALFAAIKAKVGHPHQKLILIALADIANEYNECWPSYQYLADRAECSRRTAMRCVDELVKKGFVLVRKRSAGKGLQTSNLFKLVVTKVVTESHPSGDRESPPGCQRVTLRGDRESPDTPTDTPIYTPTARRLKPRSTKRNSVQQDLADTSWATGLVSCE